MNKRGSMVIPMVIGIAMLVTTVIIALVIVQNVVDVEDDVAAYQTAYVFNELTSANITAKSLSTANQLGFRNPTALQAANSTSGLSVALANITISAAGVVTNGSAIGWNFITLNYSYEYRITSQASADLRSNFTSGIDNVSGKIPTVLLVIAVVLIMGILVLLWQQFKKMDVSSGSSI